LNPNPMMPYNGDLRPHQKIQRSSYNRLPDPISAVSGGLLSTKGWDYDLRLTAAGAESSRSRRLLLGHAGSRFSYHPYPRGFNAPIFFPICRQQSWRFAPDRGRGAGRPRGPMRPACWWAAARPRAGRFIPDLSPPAGEPIIRQARKARSAPPSRIDLAARLARHSAKHRGFLEGINTIVLQFHDEMRGGSPNDPEGGLFGICVVLIGDCCCRYRTKRE